MEKPNLTLCRVTKRIVRVRHRGEKMAEEDLIEIEEIIALQDDDGVQTLDAVGLQEVIDAIDLDEVIDADADADDET